MIDTEKALSDALDEQIIATEKAMNLVVACRQGKPLQAERLKAMSELEAVDRKVLELRRRLVEEAAEIMEGVIVQGGRK